MHARGVRMGIDLVQAMGSRKMAVACTCLQHMHWRFGYFLYLPSNHKAMVIVQLIILTQKP
jgi:hypothetical protein